MIFCTQSILLRCFLLILLLMMGLSAVASAQGPPAPKQLNIAIILDLSNSMDSGNRSLTLKSKELVKALSPLFQLDSENRYFIIGVSTEPTTILDGSTDRELALKALAKVASKHREGGTALYDACYLGVEKVIQQVTPRQVLLVISDGVDTTSKKYWTDVNGFLVERKVKLYAIDVGDPKHRLGDKGARALDRMASISGGEAFHPKRSEDLTMIIESIIAKLKG